MLESVVADNLGLDGERIARNCAAVAYAGQFSTPRLFYQHLTEFLISPGGADTVNAFRLSFCKTENLTCEMF